VISGIKKFKELDVKIVLVCVIVLLVGFLAIPILAADGPAAPDKAATGSAATTAPTTAPADAAKVVATVGTAKITAGAVSEQFNRMIANAPRELQPDEVDAARKQALGGLIYTELGNQYIASKHMTCSDEELAAKKKEIEDAVQKQGMTLGDALSKMRLTDDRLRDIVKANKVVDSATTADKVEAFVKAHPDYLNGTTVKASHILIKCDPAASTADQKAAIAKLEKLSADIKAGKVSFEQAAKDNSDCPSKDNGGDLGKPFVFASMVEPFSKAAFAMKVGEISGVVRSQFGFHIIKVTGRTEGKEPAGADTIELAKKMLGGELQDELLAMPLKDTPIVVTQ
jgi:peptidyl-prolyl cis-trans isomerase C